MSRFKKLVDSPTGSKYILQGNEAFALGVVHAGYHAADGYPGTPSTEVIDKGLAFVQDRLKVGWSVNEAVSVGVAVGHSMAGSDTVVTMKIPGLFQAGDTISTAAFYSVKSGALVIYAATDYIPSSTQHVIDARYFLASIRLPVLEPRHHQEMYDMAWIAADMSKQFCTPVVILVSGILAHSEGLVTLREPRTVAPLEIPDNLHSWMLMPAFARKNYDIATTRRIPDIRLWAEGSSLVEYHRGTDDFGIICNGEATMIVKETLDAVGLNPSVLSLAITNPLPVQRVTAFAKGITGRLFVVEDGDKFLEERIRLNGIPVSGKGEDSVITNWTPEDVLHLLADYVGTNSLTVPQSIDLQPVKRPPSICPGCPYRALGLTVAKLKKKKKIYASFGDIGCSTLLYFLDALDTVLCMGASDSVRQGFVLSRPEMAHQTISIIGDSCECHSGLDATRNAVFRNTPGVKIILDNSITAMTGGQPAPSSKCNLAGVANKFNLKEAVAAEKGRTVTVDAYNLKEVERVLTEALDGAIKGEFTTLILEGSCIHEVEPIQRIRQSKIVAEICKKCGRCNICPGIELDDQNFPHYTILCTNCGSNTPLCMQQCSFGAIQRAEEEDGQSDGIQRPEVPTMPELNPVSPANSVLPSSLRLAIRGIGGQGNLFFGKVLSELALRTSYVEKHIVKGDTHGMAQLGGPVISTFACGNVHSPVLAPRSADVLVVMEIGEVLRPGFLDLLKENGTILLNRFKVLPATIGKEGYPDIEKIEKKLEKYNVITINAYDLALGLGDKAAKTVNVIVLGILSTIEPFNHIPLERWLAALSAVSKKDAIDLANRKAFIAGRNYCSQ